MKHYINIFLEDVGRLEREMTYTTSENCEVFFSEDAAIQNIMDYAMNAGRDENGCPIIGDGYAEYVATIVTDLENPEGEAEKLNLYDIAAERLYDEEFNGGWTSQDEYRLQISNNV